MDININMLLGKTIISIQNNEGYELIFNCSDGTSYKQYHNQDCCESVVIDDIVGDISDLIGSPVLQADEVTNTDDTMGHNISKHESFTWTFYHIATIKGYVTIKWLGISNGYYSESVYFKQL